jgi:predicted  nucleic acid-binding Zn-ribbon protein
MKYILAFIFALMLTPAFADTIEKVDEYTIRVTKSVCSTGEDGEESTNVCKKRYTVKSLNDKIAAQNAAMATLEAQVADVNEQIEEKQEYIDELTGYLEEAVNLGVIEEPPGQQSHLDDEG